MRSTPLIWIDSSSPCFQLLPIDIETIEAFRPRVGNKGDGYVMKERILRVIYMLDYRAVCS